MPEILIKRINNKPYLVLRVNNEKEYPIQQINIEFLWKMYREYLNANNIDTQSMLWVEKYRPKTIDELIGQKEVKKIVKAYLKNLNIPHMLFTGPPGTGKTTTALIIARTLFGEKWKSMILELNASDERGIQTIRQKVKQFAKTVSTGFPFKIVFLDEADMLTPAAQHALRRIMEKYADNVRFILTANYENRIIDAIKSRCTVLHFRKLELEDIKDIVLRIAKNENFQITDEAIQVLFEYTRGDMRKIIMSLQALATETNNIEKKHVIELFSDSLVNLGPIRLMISKGDFEKARILLSKFLDRFPPQTVIREMYNLIASLNIPANEKIKLFNIVADVDYRVSQGANPYIQLTMALAALFDTLSSLHLSRIF